MSTKRTISISAMLSPNEGITFNGSPEGLEVRLHWDNGGHDDSGTSTVQFKTQQDFIDLKEALAEAANYACWTEKNDDDSNSKTTI